MRLWEVTALRLAVETRNACPARFVRAITTGSFSSINHSRRVGIFECEAKNLTCFAWFEPGPPGGNIELVVWERTGVNESPDEAVKSFHAHPARDHLAL